MRCRRTCWNGASPEPKSPPGAKGPVLAGRADPLLLPSLLGLHCWDRGSLAVLVLEEVGAQVSTPMGPQPTGSAPPRAKSPGVFLTAVRDVVWSNRLCSQQPSCYLDLTYRWNDSGHTASIFHGFMSTPLWHTCSSIPQVVFHHQLRFILCNQIRLSVQREKYLPKLNLEEKMGEKKKGGENNRKWKQCYLKYALMFVRKVIDFSFCTLAVLYVKFYLMQYIIYLLVCMVI